jgi:hypothetical protein
MLSLVDPKSPQTLPEALAGLIAVFRAGAEARSGPAVLLDARARTRPVLSHIRRHLRENALLVKSLEGSAPASTRSLRPIARCHRMLRRMTHELCYRLRTRDAEGVRSTARMLLAFVLDHASRERRLLCEVASGLGSGAARRFVDAISGMERGDRSPSPGGTPISRSPADPRALSAPVLQHLVSCSPKSISRG